MLVGPKGKVSSIVVIEEDGSKDIHLLLGFETDLGPNSDIFFLFLPAQIL